MAAAERIEVLVCHDNPVLQAGLMATLARHGDLACTGDDGSVLTDGFGAKPDVIVADHGRGLRSSSASAGVRDKQRPRVLIVTHSDRERDIRAALSDGVQGYLLLEDAPEHLAPAIRALRLGKLGATSRTQAMAIAQRRGLLESAVAASAH